MGNFFNSPAGKATAIGLIIIALGVAIWQVVANLRPSDAASLSADRMFVDAETGKPFEHTLQAGERLPVPAPSGKNSGYPAELCYWTKDGKTKEQPTAVLLNSWVGKKGATFCPDCGRLVVNHNPPPGPDTRVPPTEAEYHPRGGS